MSDAGVKQKEKRRAIRILQVLAAALFCIFLFSACQKAPEQSTALAAPTGLRMEEDDLCWNPVENAAGYIVEIDGKEIEAAGCRLDTFLHTTQSKTYRFRVRAKGDPEKEALSDWSEVLEHQQTLVFVFQMAPSSDGEGYIITRAPKINPTGKLVIPAYNKADGKPIVGIARSAFQNCDRLTSVIIPATVKVVKDDAFLNCIGLKRVYFENGTGEVDIGSDVFANCVSLAKVQLSDGVRLKGGLIFYNCWALGEITLPSRLDYVPGTLFWNCVSLKEITIPASVKSFGECVFEGCDQLVSLTVEPGNAVYRSENNCIIRKEDDVLITGIQTSVIPPSVKSIAPFAFSRCYGLREIVIPGTVKVVSDDAFTECTGLERVIIEEGVQRLGSEKSTSAFPVFSGCTSLKELEIPASVEVLGGRLVSGCDSLTKLTVHPGNAVFYSEGNCIFRKAEPEVLLVGSVTGVIPSYVKKIGDYAYYNRNLTEIVIPEGVEEIGERAFYNTSLTRVVLPDTLKKIGSYAFAMSDYYLLEEAGMTGIPKLPETLKNADIPAAARSDNADRREGLIEVRLPEGLLSIGRGAFSENRRLVVILPGGVQEIGTAAFYAAGIYTDLSSRRNQPEGWAMRKSKKDFDYDVWDFDRAHTVYNCTIEKDDNGAYVAAVTISEKVLLNYGHRAAVPLRTGYTFRGWATEPGGEVVYAPTETELFGGIAAENTIEVGTVLYAVWEANA